MLIPTPVPNGPQGNSQFQNKPFGFNNTVGMHFLFFVLEICEADIQQE